MNIKNLSLCLALTILFHSEVNAMAAAAQRAVSRTSATAIRNASPRIAAPIGQTSSRAFKSTSKPFKSSNAIPTAQQTPSESLGINAYEPQKSLFTNKSFEYSNDAMPTAQQPPKISWWSWFINLFSRTPQRQSVSSEVVTDSTPIKSVLSESEPSTNATSLALIEAVQSGSKETLLELIKKGLVDINARYDNNDTILHIAAKGRISPDIISILIDAGADINAKNKYKETPLHRAAYFNNAEAVKLLIAKGANPNAREYKGKSPLYFAQEDNRPSKETLAIIQLLEPITDKSLWFVVTPEIALQRAILSNRLDDAKQLLTEQTFSKKVLDETLIETISKYRTIPEAVALLISAGANVNTKNSIQKTPLHYAAFYLNPTMVKLLIKNGANPNTLDSKEKTPLDYVEEDTSSSQARIEIIKILEPLTNKRKSISKELDAVLSLHKAIESNQLADVQQILAQHTFNREELDNALLEAASGSRPVRAGMLAALLDAGADIHAKNKYKETSLHRAAYFDNAEAVKLLLSRNANPNARNHIGKSPLYLAQEEDIPSKETLEIIRLLEPVTDKSLWFVVTPEVMLRRAVKGGNKEQVRSLLNEEAESSESSTTKPQGTSESSNQQTTNTFTIGSQEELLKAWQQVDAGKSAYDILNIDKNSSKKEINAAYTNWVRNHHPDRYKDNDLNQKATSVLQYLNANLNR